MSKAFSCEYQHIVRVSKHSLHKPSVDRVSDAREPWYGLAYTSPIIDNTRPDHLNSHVYAPTVILRAQIDFSPTIKCFMYTREGHFCGLRRGLYSRHQCRILPDHDGPESEDEDSPHGI